MVSTRTLLGGAAIVGAGYLALQASEASSGSQEETGMPPGSAAGSAPAFGGVSAPMEPWPSVQINLPEPNFPDYEGARVSPSPDDDGSSSGSRLRTTFKKERRRPDTSSTLSGGYTPVDSSEANITLEDGTRGYVSPDAPAPNMSTEDGPAYSPAPTFKKEERNYTPVLNYTPVN